MLEIWYVRHGSTDWNKEKRWQGNTDIHLNEEGRAQARALAENLRGVDFTEVWSSDLSRCLETAQLALPHVKFENVRIDPRLREIPMGIVEGRTWAELSAQEQKAIEAWWSEPYRDVFPGAQESLQDVTNRAEAWRRDLKPKEGRVIAFTHGGIIRTIIWNIVGPPSRERKWLVELGNTGVVRIRYDGGYPSIISLNDMSHIKNAWELPPAQNVPGSC